MSMPKEFEQLERLLSVVQTRLDPKAFSMYRSGYLTIATWDDNETIVILADAPVEQKFEKTIYQLYKQLMVAFENKLDKVL